MNKQIIILIFSLLIVFAISFYLKKSEEYTTIVTSDSIKNVSSPTITSQTESQKIQVTNITTELITKHEITDQNYNEILMVFDFFTDYNTEDIDSIIGTLNIQNVNDLVETIDDGKDKKSILKYTKINKNDIYEFTKSDGEVSLDINSETKLKDFAELYKIPILTIQTISNIVNNQNLLNTTKATIQTTSVSNDNTLDLQNPIQNLYNNLYIKQLSYNLSSLEKFAVDVYFGIKSIHDSYFKLISFLGIDNANDKLSKKSININQTDDLTPQIEKIKKISNEVFNNNDKDINTLAIYFQFKNMLSLSIQSNIDELLDTSHINNNHNNDINSLFNSRLSDLRDDFPILIDTDNEQVLSVIKNFNIEEKIENKLIQHNKNKEGNIKFNNPIIENSTKSQLLNTPEFKKVHDQEYKTLKKLDKESNKVIHENEMLKYQHISQIQSGLKKCINDIYKDIKELFSLRKEDLDKKSKHSHIIDKDKAISSNMIDQYIFYFKNIFFILIKEDRMFYVGLILIFISICLFFIEITY